MIEGLYAVLDNSPRPERSHEELARTLLEAGVKTIQLRNKNAPARRLLETARRTLSQCRRTGALLIINDRLDVALAAGADGVHLGQGDLPLAAARRIAPKNFVIGVSTHGPEEARTAEQGGADYIGFGPIFPTESKTDAHDVRGTNGLAETVRSVKIPVVAIGGISLDNAGETIRAGATGAAVLSALTGVEDPGEAARKFLRIIREARE